MLKSKTLIADATTTRAWDRLQAGATIRTSIVLLCGQSLNKIKEGTTMENKEKEVEIEIEIPIEDYQMIEAYQRQHHLGGTIEEAMSIMLQRGCEKAMREEKAPK